jgi:micrococcal nuclease
MADKQLYRYAITPLRVIDGDTLEAIIDLGFNIRLTEHIRLFGVNTPELPSLDGQTAKAFTARWVFRGLQLWIVSNKYDAREKYGRVLATIHADGDPVSLNDALLSGGYAVKM